MTKKEQQYKINVESEWNIYSNISNNYHIMYKAYNKLIKYIEEGITIGYEWLKDFIIDKTQKIKNRIKRISENGDAFHDIHRTAKWFYLMYYYDFKGRFLYSKLGTTERTLYRRASEHAKNKEGIYSTIGEVKIIKGWDCGEINPKHIEIDMIDFFGKIYPDAYCPNDRFNIIIDPYLIEEKINEWLPIYSNIR